MRKTIFAFALTIAPSILVAQQTTSTAQSSAAVTARATTSRTQAATTVEASNATSASAAPSTFSAENRAQIDATFSAAREHNLPQQPIRDRIAEGSAKGASEAQVVLAARHAETRLEASQQAMARAGRKQHSQVEVMSGYQAMAHGATSVQLETVAKHTSSNRSVVAAFDALAQLEARGSSPDGAIAQVVASLDANASDQSLGKLAAGSSTQASGAGSLVNGAASATGTVSGATSVAGKHAAVAGGVTGAVGAVIKPPME